MFVEFDLKEGNAKELLKDIRESTENRTSTWIDTLYTKNKGVYENESADLHL